MRIAAVAAVFGLIIVVGFVFLFIAGRDDEDDGWNG